MDISSVIESIDDYIKQYTLELENAKKEYNLVLDVLKKYPYTDFGSYLHVAVERYSERVHLIEVFLRFCSFIRGELQ